jgi:hypothetical protein
LKWSTTFVIIPSSYISAIIPVPSTHGNPTNITFFTFTTTFVVLCAYKHAPSIQPSIFTASIATNPFFVVQYQPGQGVPSALLKDLTSSDGGFLSLMRTKEENSLVGEFQEWMPESLGQLSTWTCIKIMGPMGHNLTSIMANLTAPLKAAQVPIFAISTWNTDYVLVPTKMIQDATTALTKDSWVFI